MEKSSYEEARHKYLENKINHSKKKEPASIECEQKKYSNARRRIAENFLKRLRRLKRDELPQPQQKRIRFLRMNKRVVQHFFQRGNGNNFDVIQFFFRQNNVSQIRTRNNNLTKARAHRSIDFARDPANRKNFPAHTQTTCHCQILLHGNLFQGRNDSSSHTHGSRITLHPFIGLQKLNVKIWV